MALRVALPPRLVAPFVRGLFGWAFQPQPDWVRVRRRLEAVTAWPGAPRGIRVEHTTLGGVHAERLTPQHVDPQVTLLYLHGGGYTVGSARTHRGVAARLAAAMRATAYVLDYRLAPEHPCPAAAEDSVAAYRELLDRGIPAQRIAVAGDSAGGGLSLVVGITAVLEQLPVPGVLGLICPGVDGSPDALGALPDVAKDAVLTKAMVTSFMTAYLDALDPDLPGAVVSPLHADLAGLPPLVIDTGADDLIVGQARDLVAKARAAGVEVHYREHPGLWHVFHALVGILPQADRAVDDLAAQLARRVNPHLLGPSRAGTPFHRLSATGRRVS